MNTHVVLVNTDDEPLGLMPKLEAHQKGLLHRAFSVFIFNFKGQLLLQQRAFDKYHSGGLWTNTCCSHPGPNETIKETAEKRLKEEMGITCALVPTSKFIYKAALENGLTEYELDHVLIGYTDEQPNINKAEANNFKYMDIDELRSDFISHPENYTVWFKPALEELLNHLMQAESQLN